MPSPKTIQLFLMDGVVDGRVKSTLANWTGLVYKIPRTFIRGAQDIPALEQTGVYFLFGIDESDGQGSVYVGQAGTRQNGRGVLGRIEEHCHDANKDYFNQAVVMTTSNNSFGPTEISYLEHRFTQIAKDARRYHVKNGNLPSRGNITEEKQAELEEFISYAELVMGSLGFFVFEPLVRPRDTPQEETQKQKAPVLELKERGAVATGQQTSEGFVVFVIHKFALKLPELAHQEFFSNVNVTAHISVKENLLKIFFSPAHQVLLNLS
ncbi:GIY-YIG nuclease family protein [Rothia sp. CCM 9419]|uniref:GIY-YIG nuclease family protein n=1 Tax=Rothia sp. CCM 9419 TaxID=3402662 RepID=UPI003AE2CC67